MKVSILGIGVSRLGFDDSLKACERQIDARAGGYICFVNVHSVTESTGNPELRDALNQAFLSVADGMPLVWAASAKGTPVGSRVCGPDFTAAFLRSHADQAQGFIGGRPGQAEELARRFKLREIVTYCTPMRPFSPENVREDWEAFLRLCPGGRPPSMVWVGLGAPKQELWMSVAAKLAPDVFFFGIGAAFDFLTDQKTRAPLWMQKSGLEWSFRLAQEPRRLWKRYLGTNSRFLVLLAGELLGVRKS